MVLTLYNAQCLLCICVKDRRRHSDDLVTDILEPFARSMMVEPITYGKYHDNSIYTECAKAMSDRPPPSCLQCGTTGHMTADCAHNPDNYGKRNGNSSSRSGGNSRHSTGRINESSRSGRNGDYAAVSPLAKHSDRQRRPASEGSNIRGGGSATDSYDVSGMQPSLLVASVSVVGNSLPGPPLFGGNGSVLPSSVMLPPPPSQPFQWRLTTCLCNSNMPYFWVHDQQQRNGSDGAHSPQYPDSLNTAVQQQQQQQQQYTSTQRRSSDYAQQQSHSYAKYADADYAAEAAGGSGSGSGSRRSSSRGGTKYRDYTDTPDNNSSSSSRRSRRRDRDSDDDDDDDDDNYNKSRSSSSRRSRR
eukprot:6149-Heterococcus_DN1.PRE.1